MHKSLEAFKVYPRGFLGAHLHERVQKEDRYLENNRGFIPVKVNTLKKSTGVNDYNHAIEELWSAHVRESTDSTSFEFRERVFKVALVAFGARTFHEWFFAQLHSPFVGSLQRDFLDDTLAFLTKGRRKMFLENWAALLHIDNADEGSMKTSQITREFFHLDGSVNFPATTIEELVQQWCSKPNGFEDLLGTLHILFGNT